MRIWNPKKSAGAGIHHVGVRKRQRSRFGPASSLIPERSSRWHCGKIRFTRDSTKLKERMRFSCCQKMRHERGKLCGKWWKGRRLNEWDGYAPGLTGTGQSACPTRMPVNPGKY